MPAHALLDIQATVPAYPLGRPVDGRPRFGMTQEQARIYWWLVRNRSHTRVFALSFRDVSEGTGHEVSTVHACVMGLIERGWLYKIERQDRHPLFAFVRPVKMFKEPRGA